MDSDKTSLLSDIECREKQRIKSCKRILLYLIQEYPNISRTRLQKLVFYSEVVNHKLNNTQLTSVRWKPYMYGMYSHDVNNAITQLCENNKIEKNYDWVSGKIERFSIKSTEIDLNPNVKEILETALEETKDYTKRELENWEKDTHYYESTEYDHIVRFE